MLHWPGCPLLPRFEENGIPLPSLALPIGPRSPFRLALPNLFLQLLFSLRSFEKILNTFVLVNENLKRLLQKYRTDKRTQQLIQLLQKEQETPTRAQLLGMVGAQASFVLAITYMEHPKNHVLIANDKEEAAYIQNNLASLFEKKPILFFPDSFKRPMFFDVLNGTNMLQRTETINKITQSKALGEILVTYPEAIFEKVVAPKLLEENKIELTVTRR